MPRATAVLTVHGRETRQKRADTSAKLAELHQLEQLGFTCGLYPEGTERMRGRKPISQVKVKHGISVNEYLYGE